MKIGFFPYLLFAAFGFGLGMRPPAAAAQNASYGIQMQVAGEEDAVPRVGEDLVIEVHITVQSRRGGVSSQFYRNYVQPAFPAGLTIVDRSESTRSSVAIVNGRYTQEFSHVMAYVVRPTQPGKLLIGPASMEADGQLYRSNALEIQVAPPRAAPRVILDGQDPDPAVADDEFLQVTVSRSELYLGQPVVVSWWLYTTSRLTERPQSDPPDSPGFFSKSLFSQNHTYEMERVQLGSNVFYRTLVFRRMYWPQRSGRLVIAPRTVAYRTRSGFLNTGKTETRTSAEVAFDVKPLPATGRPADFVEDHVGKFRIRLDLAAASLKVGDAVDLTVTLTGEALMTACRGPAMPSLDWARIEPNGSPAISETIENEERVRGEWKGRYVFIATREGSHTFPALSFSYFDPEEGQYKTIQTNPVPLTVAPAPPGSVKLPPPGTGPSSPAASTNVLAPRLKPPAVGPVSGSSLRARFWEGSWRWAALALPPMVWAVTALVLAISRRRAADVDAQRRKASRRRRREGIAHAKAALHHDRSEEFYAECTRLLLDLLSDIIGRPAAGSVHAQLQADLTARGVPEDLAGAVMEMLESLDFARYAPGKARAAAGDRNAQWTKIQDLVRRLEAYVK